MCRSWRALGERSRALPRVALAFGLIYGPGALPASPGPMGDKPRLRNRVPDSAGVAVWRALLAAKRRLADPGCAQLLSEFRSNGLRRPLMEVLELMGRTPGEHLGALAFEDGTRKVGCAPPSVLAFTHVGGDTIYVCAGKFRGAVQNDPTYAEMILIHEMLHTLGLGENPPTSLEITARVTERCGDVRAGRVANDGAGGAQ